QRRDVRPALGHGGADLPRSARIATGGSGRGWWLSSAVAPAFRGRRGSKPRWTSPRCQCLCEWRRPSEVGEDRNQIMNPTWDPVTNCGAGLPRSARIATAAAHAALPVSTWWRRPSEVGEDRNQIMNPTWDPVTNCGAGLPRSARIATAAAHAALPVSTWWRRPSEVGEDRNSLLCCADEQNPLGGADL